MDHSKDAPTVLAFCAGYGGIERGLELAGVEHRVLAYVEIEAFAAANLVAKMEAGELAPAPVWTDLKTFPVGLFRGAVDIITGGYPCQPFSAAGKRLGHEDPRHLWPYISEAIGVIRPRRVFFENVEGHISLGLNEVISDLEARGYDTTWGIFSAVEVGAPHQRKRTYVMANAHRTGQQPGERERQARHHARRCGKAMANAQRAGLEGHAGHGAGSDEPGRQSPQADGSVSQGSVRGGPAEHDWTVEPGLGRVVDGCPDRVDRIRLLGNGVVPQTAARAWQVLDAELAEPIVDWDVYEAECEKGIEIVAGMNAGPKKGETT